MSASTAGVLACQWNNAPLKISVLHTYTGEPTRGSPLPHNRVSG